MSTASKPRLMTAEEYMAADLGDGLFELVRGEVVRMSPPLYQHGAVCYRLAYVFGRYENQSGFGHGATNDTSIRTRRNPDTVRGADFVFYSNARWPKSEEAPVVPPVAPDVVVEVVSPNDRRGEIAEKVAEYLDAGVLAVWIVEPKRRTIAIHRPGFSPVVLGDLDSVEDQPELPGFRCTVIEIVGG